MDYLNKLNETAKHKTCMNCGSNNISISPMYSNIKQRTRCMTCGAVKLKNNEWHIDSSLIPSNESIQLLSGYLNESTSHKVCGICGNTFIYTHSMDCARCQICGAIERTSNKWHIDSSLIPSNKSIQLLSGYIKNKPVQTKKRITWQKYFMGMAKLAAKRSTCLRRQVGAVAVKDNHILATGYNGAPKGEKHCIELGCLREQLEIPSGEKHELCRGVHAEQNLICQAAVNGVSIKGATVYCTLQPCYICAKMLVNSCIATIIFLEGYNDPQALKLLQGRLVKLSGDDLINVIYKKED